MTCDCKAPAADEDTACSAGESFALRVLGDDMLPEFREGDIIIVEPDGALADGSFVLARPGGQWVLRQLARSGPAWCLRALNPPVGHAGETPLSDLSEVHGIVIQKAVPGKRKLSKSYL